jgi:hypothetical protein
MLKNKSPIIIPLDGMPEEDAYFLASEIKDYIWGVKFNDLLDLKGIEIIRELEITNIPFWA